MLTQTPSHITFWMVHCTYGWYCGANFWSAKSGIAPFGPGAVSGSLGSSAVASETSGPPTPETGVLRAALVKTFPAPAVTVLYQARLAFSMTVLPGTGMSRDWAGARAPGKIRRVGRISVGRGAG